MANFDEILKRVSTSPEEPQKTTSSFDAILKRASTKRRATQADQKILDDATAYAKNVFKDYKTDFSALNFNSSKGMAEKYNNYLQEYTKKAENAKNLLMYIDVDDVKKNEIVKDINDTQSAINQMLEQMKSAENFYNQFESQAHADTWKKEQDYLSSFATVDEAISDLETKIATKTAEYNEALKKDKETARKKYGGAYARANVQNVVSTDSVWASSETKELEKEIQEASMFLENLKAQNSRDKKATEIKDKYVLFKGDNQYDIIAETGAALKNPSLEEMQKYEQLEKQAHAHNVFARDEMQAMGEVSIKNPVRFFLDNKDVYEGRADSLVPYVYDLSYNWASTMLNGYKNAWAQLTEDELKMYDYLLVKRGRQEAYEYLKTIEPYLNERQAKEEETRLKEEYSQLNSWEKAGKNIETIITNPTNNLWAGIEALSDFATGDYDPNNYYARKTAKSSQLRELTAQDLTKNMESEFFKTLVSTTYQSAMSGLDSLVGSLMFGGGAFGSSAYALTSGLGAMSSKAQELAMRGVDKEKIAIGAITSGLFEGLFEKISLGHFFNKSDFSSIKKAIKTMLVQGGVEASEEFMTEVANIAADAVINGYNSTNWQSVYDLVSKGVPLEEAKSQVFTENFANVFWATYGGFISGAGMSGTAVVPSYIANKVITTTDRGNYVKENNDLNAFVEDLKNLGIKGTEKLDEKTPSTMQIGTVADNLVKFATEKMTTDNLDMTAFEFDSLIESVKSESAKGMIYEAFKSAVAQTAKNQAKTEKKANNKTADEQMLNENNKGVKKALKPFKNKFTRESKTPISDVILKRTTQTNEELSDEQIEKNIKTVESIGKAFGYKVVVKDHVYVRDKNGNETNIEADGAVIPGTKTMEISKNSVNPIAWIFKHEATHTAENTKNFDKTLEKFRNAEVFRQWLRTKTGLNSTTDIMLEALARQKANLYKEAGQELSVTDRHIEVYADFVADMLFTDPDSLENLIKELDKPTRNKFIQWILDLLDAIKAKFSKGDKKILNEIASLERRFTDLLKGVKTESVDNKKTPSSPDIRYSISNADISKFVPIAKKLMKQNDADGDVSDFAEVLKKSFIEAQKDDAGSWDSVMPAVRWLQNNKKGTLIDEYSRDILSALRNTRVYLDDQQKAEVASQFDSFGKFRQSLMGSIVITNKENANSSLDQAWQELSELYPNVFKADVTSNDMPHVLFETIQKLRNGDYNTEQDVNAWIEAEEADLIAQVYEAYLENAEKFEDPLASDYDQAIDELNEQLKNKEITQEEYSEKVKELFKEASRKYGAFEQGESVTGNENFENPVPRRVSDDAYIQRFTRTVLEKGEITDEMIANEKSAILSGARSYVRTSNEANIKKALKLVANGEATDRWRAVATDNKTATAEDIAVGELLLESAIESNDAKNVLKLTGELAEVGTRLGQAVQALSLLKRMGGLGQLYYIQKAVDTLNKDMEKNWATKNKPRIEIPEGLAMQLAEAKTDKDFEIAYGAILRDIGSQVPATWIDKWNAWRYMAMLANPVTMIRNLVGNGIFLPAVKTKDLIATVYEKGIRDKSKRTKVFHVTKEYRDFAQNDFDEVKDLVMHGGKYSPKDRILEERKIFGGLGVLETIRKTYGNILEGTDARFTKGYYTSALGGFLQAQKVDLNNVPNDTLVKAREYATKEALKATYRDASAIATALNSITRKNILGSIVVEGLIPFKKTPVNVLKRGIEYSPIGLLTTASKALYDLKTGKFSASEFVDGLASATTGTGIFLIGMWLAATGIVKIGFSGDDDEWWRKLNGEQEFSVQICDHSYTIDWAAPACMPFFMGATAMEIWSRENNEKIDFANIALDSLDVITETSMLQGINNVIESIKYKDNGVASILSDVALSYIAQALPTIGGKIKNTFDDTRRTNYVDKTTWIPEWLQTLFNKAGAKIPFIPEHRNPYVNAWGEEEKTGNIGQRFLQNFISPGYMSEVVKNEITEELTRLYKSTGEKSVLPDTAPKYILFKNTKKHLTSDEFYNYATMRGQKNAQLIDEFVHHKDYDSLTDAQKAKIIKDLYEYSNAFCKSYIPLTYEEFSLLGVVDITKEEYEQLTNEQRQALAKSYFLADHQKVHSEERNGGSVVDYYIKKESAPKKEKEKSTVSEIIEDFG